LCSSFLYWFILVIDARLPYLVFKVRNLKLRFVNSIWFMVFSDFSSKLYGTFSFLYGDPSTHSILQGRPESTEGRLCSGLFLAIAPNKKSRFRRDQTKPKINGGLAAVFFSFLGFLHSFYLIVMWKNCLLSHLQYSLRLKMCQWGL